MQMHFSFHFYGKMLGLAWRETDRAKTLARLAVFLVIPMAALIHALCYLLDNLSPRLRRARIRKPIFIIGHARSGTTLLHRLMLADEGRYSFFRAWEMAFPSLLEKRWIRALGRLDQKLLGSFLEKKLRATEDSKLAKTRDVHDTGLFAPEEDDFCQTFSCTSGFWIVLFPYMDKLDFYYWDRWPLRRRHRAMRGYHDSLRRQMALESEDRIHLSKNPTFNGRVESLLEEFPDARFVVCMRDPRESIPSLLKMLKQTWQSLGWGDERIEASIEKLIEQSLHSYRHPREVLSRSPDTAWCEVDYRELTVDPQSAVEKIYATLDLEVSPSLQTALQAAGARRGSHKTGHTYDLEEFGLDSATIENALPELFTDYGWNVAGAVPAEPEPEDR
jgi:hypothetical protein